MRIDEIRKNKPDGATCYRYNQELDIVSYFKETNINFHRHGVMYTEQYLWYQDKWVYCTPLTGDIKPL